MKLSPDCRDGNHHKCDGVAWDDDLDEPTACECYCQCNGRAASRSGRSTVWAASFDETHEITAAELAALGRVEAVRFKSYTNAYGSTAALDRGELLWRLNEGWMHGRDPGLPERVVDALRNSARGRS